MKLEQLKYIYFLGIGGIGMSALARWFHAKGYQVSGYDKTATALTNKLQEEGIAVHFEDDPKNIPGAVLQHKAESLVVITPAVPADSKELIFLKENGFSIKKRSEVLGIITALHYTVAVAGTHGKTTTSSIVAHLLHHADFQCSAFLGGISVNLNSNLLLNPGTDNDDLVVVEADEFDRSFLTLHPNIAIVTSADADHLDIYGDKNALTASFSDFIGQIQQNGYLIIHHELVEELTTKLDSSVKIFTYGFDQGDLRAENVRIADHKFVFEVVSPLGNLKNLELSVPGFHNVENALAAILACQLLNMPEEQLISGIKAYKGVKRRFEYIWEKNGKVYIDDYAHHPREIEAFLNSVKALYPGKKIKVIFQPHLFTRTRDFADDFAKSLSISDEVVLLDIYPAREKPIEGITSELILNKIQINTKSLSNKAEILANLSQNRDFDVLATVGAGDVDTLVSEIKNILEKDADSLE